MPRHCIEVEILLIKLEQYLKEHHLWSPVHPSAAAMQSQMPFAVDSMPFEHWLQFIFIPKTADLVIAKSTLPKTISLVPMAEMTLCSNSKHARLLDILKQMDTAFVNQH